MRFPAENLSDIERIFLIRMGLTKASVYDGSGMRRSDAQAAAKKVGAILISGASPCKAEGHRLRTRKGHCAQCNIIAVDKLKRYYSSGYVYIAFSGELNSCKVGSTTDLKERLKRLRGSSYGGVADWVIYNAINVDSAALIEGQLHLKLDGFKASGEYYFDGQDFRYPRELYNISPSEAWIFLLDLAQDSA